MTSLPSPSRSPPRKIISESLDTRSLPGGRLAQLVSKFEFLDAVASVGNSPRPSSKTKPVAITSPPSTIAQTSSKTPQRLSQESEITREGSSIDSHFSPLCFTTSNQMPVPARRAQTFTTKSPVTPNKNVDIKSRQKSVAERRRMFETSSQQTGKHDFGSFWLNINNGVCRDFDFSSCISDSSVTVEVGLFQKLAITQEQALCCAIYYRQCCCHLRANRRQIELAFKDAGPDIPNYPFAQVPSCFK